MAATELIAQFSEGKDDLRKGDLIAAIRWGWCGEAGVTRASVIGRGWLSAKCGTSSHKNARHEAAVHAKR